MMVPKRTKAKIYTIRVTDVKYNLETIDDIGLPKDSIWRSERIYYGFHIKGRRIDQTNMPAISVIVPVQFGGNIFNIQVGDIVLVYDDPNQRFPIALGVVYSQTLTWTEAVKNRERPIPPQLESPGSFGNLYNYNAIYGTYIPGYKDSGKGTWYDRFIKFPVGYFVKDKRSLPEYNKWFKEAYEEKKKGKSDLIFDILEDWSCLYRKEKFFYVGKNRFPWRPDPVFDTTSQAHQSIASSTVIKSKEGIGFFDERTKQATDKYPLPLSQQNISDGAKFSAFDEIINAKLSELRKNKGNIDNFELPLEPRVVQEIRIGRNKLVISDVYGDGSAVLITLKNEKDAGISIVYQEFTNCNEVKKDCQSYKNTTPEYPLELPEGEGKETEGDTVDSANTSCDDSKISQVRIRGVNGESILLESFDNGSDTFSRTVIRGINGQFVEIFDDLGNNSNYIYTVSPKDKEYTKDDWSLQEFVYTFLVAGSLDTTLKRLSNNQNISEFSSGLFASYGTYSNGERISYRHFLDDESNIIEKLFMKNSCNQVTELKNITSSEIDWNIEASSCNGAKYTDVINLSSSVTRETTWTVNNNTTTVAVSESSFNLSVTDGTDTSSIYMDSRNINVSSKNISLTGNTITLTNTSNSGNKITIDGGGIEVGTGAVTSVRLAGGGPPASRVGDLVDGLTHLIIQGSSKVTIGG